MCQVSLVVKYTSHSGRVKLRKRFTVRNMKEMPGPEVIKMFSYSTQLSTKFILLINFKMQTIFGILAIINRIHTTSERLKANTSLFIGIFSFYEQLKF